ncbi:MAG TPA: DUF2306 domain-containing protein [Caulobacteraceae bacterium]|nr:DUF2306 domain-containing protein [Caulobacteraceae bacterium]
MIGHALTYASFALHIAGGTVALFAGLLALFTRKGGRIHRAAGTVFFAAMLVMAAFAAWLAVTIPGQLVNLFIALFAAYLVTTAWLTVRRPEGAVGIGEKLALVVGVLLSAPFVILCGQVILGLPLMVKSVIPIEGPVRIALFGFTTVLVIAALSDVRVVLIGGISGAPRIGRHLWRMCLGLTMAAGSAFTNGLPRLLPGPMHVPPAFFFPQFIPLALMVFWLIKVRFTPWLGRSAATA